MSLQSTMRLPDPAQPVNLIVVWAAWVVGVLEVVNPILQSISLVIGISWGGLQLYRYLRKKK
jgi:hypothetical protein